MDKAYLQDALEILANPDSTSFAEMVHAFFAPRLTGPAETGYDERHVLSISKKVQLKDRQTANNVGSKTTPLQTQEVVKDILRDAFQLHGAVAFEQIGRHTSELQSLMRISYAVFC